VISLGADVSTTKIALAAIDEHGAITTCCVPVEDARGARRLMQVRAAATAAIPGRFPEIAVAAVEIPWAKGASSFALLSVAAVTLEAIQDAAPGAVVLDVPTSVWKLDSVGHGNASKAEVMEHARGLGLEGDDQDLADALCLAQGVWERWHAATRPTA
jgi:Holliday junction resolvasome RuvABC endonuclease subunit